MGLEEVASGAWAGFVGTVLGYPLDVAKSRMQTGKTGAPTTVGVVGTAATRASFGEGSQSDAQKSIHAEQFLPRIPTFLLRLRIFRTVFFATHALSLP